MVSVFCACEAARDVLRLIYFVAEENVVHSNIHIILKCLTSFWIECRLFGIHKTCLCSDAYLNISCFSEDLLKVDGMDMKLSEPVTAAHLISAAKLGNSKADAVLKKGQTTKQT